MRVPELKQKQLPTTFAEKNETEMLFLYVTRLALLAIVLMAFLISKPNSSLSANAWNLVAEQEAWTVWLLWMGNFFNQ